MAYTVIIIIIIHHHNHTSPFDVSNPGLDPVPRPLKAITFPIYFGSVFTPSVAAGGCSAPFSRASPYTSHSLLFYIFVVGSFPSAVISCVLCSAKESRPLRKHNVMRTLIRICKFDHYHPVRSYISLFSLFFVHSLFVFVSAFWLWFLVSEGWWLACGPFKYAMAFYCFIFYRFQSRANVYTIKRGCIGSAAAVLVVPLSIDNASPTIHTHPIWISQLVFSL